MILLPAIDIREGRAVRLRQGDFGEETVYADDPTAAAVAFVADGARALHVVDLDGARLGSPASLPQLRRITDAVDVPVQYGGGLRTAAAVDDALAAGAERVVLGTVALRDPELLGRALEAYDDRVAVAVDVRSGRPSVAGWTETAAADAQTAIATARAEGATRFVYTDADRDGMLAGPDLDTVRRIAAAVDGGRFVYSGGVGSLDDLTALRALALDNLDGVISGKALYERRFSVGAGQSALG